MLFFRNGKIEYLTREYQAAGQFAPKQSSADRLVDLIHQTN